MNGFYVITNRSKKNAGEEAEFIKRYLEDKGCVCYLQSECEHTNEESMRYTDASAIPEDVKCIIALGGDGTLLHASRDLVDTSLPLLGVNLGTLGYLAEIEHTNIAPTLDRLIADDFFIEDRMMLQGTNRLTNDASVHGCSGREKSTMLRVSGWRCTFILQMDPSFQRTTLDKKP